MKLDTALVKGPVTIHLVLIQSNNKQNTNVVLLHYLKTHSPMPMWLLKERNLDMSDE